MSYYDNKKVKKLFPDTECDDYTFYKVKDLIIGLEEILQDNIKEKNKFTSATYSMIHAAKDFFEHNHTAINECIENEKEINLPELLQGRPAVIDSLGGILFVECCDYLQSNHHQCFILKKQNNFTKSKFLHPFSNLFMYELNEIFFLPNSVENKKFFLMGHDNSFSIRTSRLNIADASVLITKENFLKKIFVPNVLNYNNSVTSDEDNKNLMDWAKTNLTTVDIIENILYNSAANYKTVKSTIVETQQKNSLFKENNSLLMCFGIERLVLSNIQLENSCLNHELVYIKKLLMMSKNYYQNMNNPIFRFPMYNKKIVYIPSDTLIEETDLLDDDQSIERQQSYYDCVYGDTIMWAPENYVNIQISIEFNKREYSFVKKNQVYLINCTVFSDFYTMLRKFPDNEMTQFEKLQLILKKYHQGYTGPEENLFEKQFCLMPVHFINHYFLVVILYAGNINNEENINEKKNQIPCILVFDSLSKSFNEKKKITIYNTVQRFLHLKWIQNHPNDDIFKTKQIPIFLVEHGVQQDDNDSCGYCTIFNTQNVLKMIIENTLVANESNLSSNFSKLISIEMKNEMKGYLFPFIKNVTIQRKNARDQLCTWAKYISSF
jgi:hypothetical protein